MSFTTGSSSTSTQTEEQYSRNCGKHVGTGAAVEHPGGWPQSPANAAPSPSRFPDPLGVARDYVARGWRPIPIPFLHKGPQLKGWPKLQVTPDNIAKYFDSSPGNVGVLLGEPSGDLVDIDLDCPEAVALAPLFLPETLTFGRASKPRSHWLFRSASAESRVFEVPREIAQGRKKQVLLEVRSTGAQTMFPGSTHPSGELVGFDSAAEPASIGVDDLMQRAARLAAAALLVRAGWRQEEARDAVLSPRLLTARAGEPAVTAALALVEVPPDSDDARGVHTPSPDGGFGASVARYNADHRRAFPKSGGECPGCGHKGCFGQLPDNQERWACFSASHGAEHGGIEGDRVWHGDALDLDSVEAGCTRAELLKRAGYLDGDDDAVIEALKAEIRADPAAGFVNALKRPRTLWAIRRQLKETAKLELLKFELEREGLKRAQVGGLIKAAKALKRPVSPGAGAQQPVATAPAVAGQPAAPAAPALRLPTIEVYDREFRDVEQDASAALVAANTPPSVFRRGGSIVSVVVRDGVPELADYTSHTIIRVLSNVANWSESKPAVRPDADPAVTAVFPDKTVAKSLLGRPPLALPELEGVVTTPYFGCDGVIVSAPGYSAANKLYLVPAPGLVVPPVSPAPTAAEVAAAVQLIVDDLYGDFPFVHQGDLAHQVALTALPFLRCIDGTTPLHVAGAPEAGTGKGLLCDAAATVATGTAMPWRALPPREEERVKAIFSALRAGTPFVAFDNAKGEVEGPALESALTSRFVASRVLGSHTEAVAPNRATWVMTANNAELSRDLVRRSVRIRIDAKSDKPEEGRLFKHPHLLEWVRTNRGRIVHAVLTLIQNWVAKGRPPSPAPRRASFESWSDTLGGILAAAGISGFLDPATAMDNADLRRDEATAFVEAWFTLVQGATMTAKELLDMVAAPPESIAGREVAPKEPTHLASVLGGGQVGSRVVRLGKWCHRNLNRVFGAHMLVEDRPNTHAGTNRYKLVPRPVSQAAPASTSLASPGSTTEAEGVAAQPAGGGEAASGGTAGGAQEPPAVAMADEPQQ